LDLVILVAAQESELVNPSSNEAWLRDTQRLDELAQRVLRSASKENRTLITKNEQKWTPAQLEPLVRPGAEINPTYAYVVGLAYVRELVQLDEEPGSSNNPESHKGMQNSLN
jgi:hypothetical protein